MARFVQIGERAFNPERIVSVDFADLVPGESRQVLIRFDALDVDGAQNMVLKGEDAVRFERWWGNEAEVYHAV